MIDRLFERVWINEERDCDLMDQPFAEHAVVGDPQSGERIWGRKNIRAVEGDSPGLPAVELGRTLRVGDLAVVEANLDYQGKPHDEVSVFEFRDGQIVRQTACIAKPFDAPDRRAKWVEKM